MAVGSSEIRKLGSVIGKQAAAHLIGEVDTTFGDSEKIQFGTGNDASIYYDGTDLIVDPQDVGSGNLRLEGGGSLEVRGDAGAAGILRLTTAELTVVDGDELGRVNFLAPLESSGTDAILVSAAIYAEAAGTFSATVNSCDIVFATGASETATEKARLTSTGYFGVGCTPAVSLQVDDAIAVSNDAEGSTARLTIQSARESVTLTGASTDTTLAIPSGAVLLGASFNVDTAVVDDGGDDTWSAAYITGSTTSLASGAAAAQNTKVNTLVVPEVASAATEIQFTPNGGSFTAGVIEVVAYYYALTGLADAA